MINEKQTTTDKAKALIKSHYGACILSGIEASLDGCHIYPVSLFPEIKAYPIAIIPLTRFHHYRLDNYNQRTRLGKERIDYLIGNCLPDYKAKLCEQIAMLSELMREKNISMGRYAV